MRDWDAWARRSRRMLTARPVASIAKTLGSLSERWLDRNYFFRKKAVKNLTGRSGFTAPAAQALLDALFAEVTEQKLLRLLRSEIRDPRFLDDFQRDPLSGNFLKVSGPGLILHVFSANVPNPAILSFIFGMLVKSANVGKVSSRDAGFLDIYLQSLRAVDPELASMNRLIRPGAVGARRAVPLLATHADLVVAYGTDETLASIAGSLPHGKSFVGYGHRVSLAFYTRRALKQNKIADLAEKTARDIWMMDQRGCLSPLVLYVEKGGEVSSRLFSEILARSLEALTANEKFSQAVLLSRAARHEILKNRCRIRRVNRERAFFWESRPRGKWAVFYDENLSDLPFSPGNRAVCVHGFRDPRSVWNALRPVGKYLQAVALEVGGTRRVASTERKEIARRFSSLGANRICRAGRMQMPPLLWHHDGRFNLASWVSWTDLER